MRFNRILTLVFTGAVATALVGCSTQGAATPVSASSTTPASTTSTPAPSTLRITPATSAPASTPGGLTGADRAFIANIDKPRILASSTRESLIDLAHSICRAFPLPDGRMTVLEILLDSGYDAGEASELMFASAVAYCPSELTGIK